MKIFGLEITLARTKAMSSVPSTSRRGWFRIGEPYAGAWQQNVEEDQQSLLSYPTLYACISRIATDIGKLPFKLMMEGKDGIWEPAERAAYSPVLRKPNDYQTGQQFRESWMLSKLIQGNTYALKRRDNRGVVIELYILDPCRVMPMVSDSGQVFYKLYTDKLNSIPEYASERELIVPAREIIHDRCVTLYHPLVGIPPLSAAYWPALKNLKILKSSAEFFANNAQPGGLLTAPAGMTEADADLVKAHWDETYGGDNAGKVAVIGADMKFTSFAMKSADSQLVEQMRYSDEQICQPFAIPPFVVGIGSIPAGLKVDDITNTYYSFALQSHIEHMEALLDEGLKVEWPLGVELDLDPLLRMDTEKRSTVMGNLVDKAIATPNEARRQFGLKPLAGGNTVYMQQQDYPLDQVAQNKIAAAAPPPVDEELTDEEADDAIEDETAEEVLADE